MNTIIKTIEVAANPTGGLVVFNGDSADAGLGVTNSGGNVRINIDQDFVSGDMIGTLVRVDFALNTHVDGVYEITDVGTEGGVGDWINIDLAYIGAEHAEIWIGGDYSATAYSPIINGRITLIEYIKNDFVNGVDFTITTEITGQGLWSETSVKDSKIIAPRQPTHDELGAASEYANTYPVEDHIVVANERVKFIVDGASITGLETGTFKITYS